MSLWLREASPQPPGSRVTKNAGACTAASSGIPGQAQEGRRSKRLGFKAKHKELRDEKETSGLALVVGC